MEKLKTKIKMIIMLAIMVFTMCLLNVNTVNAADVTEEEMQKMLEAIPNEIKLEDISEEEALTKGDVKLQEKLNEIWKSNNLNTSNNISVYASCGRLGIMQSKDDFYKGRIVIGGKEKIISIKYKNSNEKDSTDEQRVKNVKINYPDYIPVTKDQILKMYNNYTSIFSLIKENISLSDSSFIFEVDSGAIAVEYGFPIVSYNEGEIANGRGNINIGIFKNGFLYDLKNIPCNLFPIIEVPSNISKDNLSNYIVNYMNDMQKQSGYEYAIKITDVDIIEGATVNGKAVSNGYTIKRKDGYDCIAILNFHKDETVTLQEDNTNVKLEASSTVIPPNTVLKVTPISKGETYNRIKNILTNVNKFVAFDISLLSDGVEIQPNGNVKISIPIPEGYDTSKLVVYRIEENGTKIEYAVTVVTIEGKQYAQFETDHFSNYVLAEQEPQKDNTPKTGNASKNYTGLILVISTILGLGIIKIK